jgi:hypothetical protein
MPPVVRLLIFSQNEDETCSQSTIE